MPPVVSRQHHRPVTTSSPPPSDVSLVEAVWAALDGPAGMLEGLTLTGARRMLPSAFDVTGFATATVAAAALAVAELAAARRGGAPGAVAVDRRAASAAFAGEGILSPLGWERPPVWDPVAGDYPTLDGWVRLHTNYAHHRDAVARALGVPAERDAVAAAVAARHADDVEAAVVAEGGAAAAQRSRDAWVASPAGQAAGRAPLVAVAEAPARGAPIATPTTDRALEGIRVLDLTRVIAGPECTRFLAAHGADVVRIDPPGFAEVPALLPETTVGKRCAALDLRSPAGRTAFEALVGQAHVLVVGYRPAALGAAGYELARLRALQPALVVARLDAYGWEGPWRERRGFDSLVQMSTGITAAGQAATGAPRPVPLPVQALDHGGGFVLAAVVVRALTRLLTTGRTSEARTALVGMAELLAAHPDPDGLGTEPPGWGDDDTVADTSAWGPLRRVPTPGRVEGCRVGWEGEAGPLGRHPAAFRTVAG